MYQEREYLIALKNNLTAWLAELDREIVKQGRRPNRESEKRTRKLLSSFYSRIYRPYKDASLEDLSSSRSQNKGL